MNELTASEITNEALRLLRTYGFTVWRQNNLATRGRQNNVTPGLPDIIGFGGEGKFVGCEVKKIGDKLSREQHIFLTSLKISGGYAYIASQLGTNVIVKNYEPVLKEKAKVK